MGNQSKWDKFCEWLAWRLPLDVVYWCVVRGFADASVERYTDKSPDEISVGLVMYHLRLKGETK